MNRSQFPILRTTGEILAFARAHPDWQLESVKERASNIWAGPWWRFRAPNSTEFMRANGVPLQIGNRCLDHFRAVSRYTADDGADVQVYEFVP